MRRCRLTSSAVCGSARAAGVSPRASSDARISGDGGDFLVRLCVSRRAPRVVAAAPVAAAGDRSVRHARSSRQHQGARAHRNTREPLAEGRQSLRELPGRPTDRRTVRAIIGRRANEVRIKRLPVHISTRCKITRRFRYHNHVYLAKESCSHSVDLKKSKL